MGWAGGSYIANELWPIVEPYVPEHSKKAVARIIIETLRDCDWDTLDEAPVVMEAAFGPDWMNE
jgi:hypothetical protein